MNRMAKNRERGSRAPTKCRHVARILILAAKNIIGEKIFVRKLIYEMSRTKISADAKHTFAFISSWDKRYYKGKNWIVNSDGVINLICLS